MRVIHGSCTIPETVTETVRPVKQSSVADCKQRLLDESGLRSLDMECKHTTCQHCIVSACYVKNISHARAECCIGSLTLNHFIASDLWRQT